MVSVTDSDDVGGGSGERGDAPIRFDDVVGGWPTIKDADDVSPCSGDDACRGVPERPAKPFRFRYCQGPGEAQQLEPCDKVGCPHHGLEPCLVRFELGEREPFKACVFQAPYEVLDVGVGTH
jgi:hypothetical protein